jgi:hypothetical protein
MQGEEDRARRTRRGGQGKARVNDLGIHGLGGVHTRVGWDAGGYQKLRGTSRYLIRG